MCELVGFHYFLSRGLRRTAVGWLVTAPETLANAMIVYSSIQSFVYKYILVLARFSINCGF